MASGSAEQLAEGASGGSRLKKGHGIGADADDVGHSLGACKPAHN